MSITSKRRRPVHACTDASQHSCQDLIPDPRTRQAGNDGGTADLVYNPRSQLVSNPFVSEAQRRWMYANDPEMAKEWEAKTPKGKKLPKYKKPTANKRKANPLRIDPTRTVTLRRSFSQRLKKQFMKLRARIVKLVVDEDAFGLAKRQTTNALRHEWATSLKAKSVHNKWFGLVKDRPTGSSQEEARDERGRWTKAGDSGSGTETSDDAVVHSPSFKSWFGDWEHNPSTASKVVDSAGRPQQTAEASVVTEPDGKPMVVYHGTPRGAFDKFDASKVSNPDALHFGPGFYFTEDVKAAEVFAHSNMHAGEKESPTVLKLYLNVRKPFDVDKDKISTRDLSDHDKESVRQQVVTKAFQEEGRHESIEAGREFDKGERAFTYKELTDKYGVSKTAVRQLLERKGHDGLTVSSPVEGDPKKARYWIAFEPAQVKDVHAKNFDPKDPIITHARAMTDDDVWEVRQDVADELAKLFGVHVDEDVLAKLIRSYLHVNNEQQRDERGRFAGAASFSTKLATKALGKIKKSFVKFRDRYGTAGALAITAAMLTPLPGVGFGSIAAAEGIKFIVKHYGVTHNVVTNAGRFEFSTTSEAIEAFQAWLEEQLADLIDGASEEELWAKYVEEGWKRGASRAWDDTKGAVQALAADKEKLDFYRGTRDQFLRSAFNQAVQEERIKVLAGRTFDDLENVTHDMATRMSRTLTDGLARGDNPRQVAADLDDDLDIGMNRANTIAQTEIIRAHAEGQLDAFEELDVDELGVAVEWATADDDAVCPECSEMEGVVLDIDEARGMIPRHPNCRCAFIPANVGESEKDQVRGKTAIDRAVKASAEAGNDDFDADISRARPHSVLNANPLVEFERLLLNGSNDQPRDTHGRWSGPSMRDLLSSADLSTDESLSLRDEREGERQATSTEYVKPDVKAMWKAYKTADAKAKDYIAAAFWNADVDPDAKSAPHKVPDENKLTRQLAIAHRDLANAGGSPEQLAQVEAVAKAHGMVKVGEPGEHVQMDGEYHQATRIGMFNGDNARVTKSGWGKVKPNGNLYLPMKAEVT